MDFKTFERNTRDASYGVNLDKEARITKVYCDWCDKHGISYEVNPADSKMNCLGCDVTVNNGHKAYIDIKGCVSRYDTVCLTYERSYDGKNWRPVLNEHKITSAYVFIDELDNIYSISMHELKEAFDSFKKTTASPDKAGHWQRVILIPKYMLHALN